MRKKLLWILFIIPLILSVITMEANAQESDIAVISVTPSKTQVKLGDFVNITVVVENEGDLDATFNVTVYYDSSIIETKTNITLAAGANTSLTFSWNTTGTGEEVYATAEKQKTYNLNATASTVPGETDTADNTLVSDSTVTIKSQYIAIVPDTISDPTLTAGKNFTISIITDYNGSDIWGYQFTLAYNPLVLQGVSVINGDLITNATFPAFPPPPARFSEGEFDNTLGRLSLTVGYFDPSYSTPPPTTSGPGTLANVTFAVIGTGDSNITFGKLETQLKSPTININIVDFITPYKSHFFGGYFRNVEEIIHDVAVISVTPSPTSVIEGELVNITVVVGNEGNVPEIFGVRVDYLQVGSPEGTAKLIDEINVQNLAANAQRTLKFSWKTEAVSFGDYTIKATAQLSNDMNTANNKLTSDKIITVRSDIQPFPIEMLLGAVVVVGGIVAALVIVMRIARKKKK